MKNNTFGYLLTFALLLGSSIVWGQAPQSGKVAERIKSLKVGYITEKLSLTPEESQGFWPIYNEFEAAQNNIRKEFRQDFGKIDPSITDEKAESMILANFEMEEKLLELKRAYFKKMKAVIPVRKFAQLNRAERQFKKELLNRMQNRKQRRMGKN